jgi:hypothetical protein
VSKVIAVTRHGYRAGQGHRGQVPRRGQDVAATVRKQADLRLHGNSPGEHQAGIELLLSTAP